MKSHANKKGALGKARILYLMRCGFNAVEMCAQEMSCCIANRDVLN